MSVRIPSRLGQSALSVLRAQPSCVILPTCLPHTRRHISNLFKTKSKPNPESVDLSNPLLEEHLLAQEARTANNIDKSGKPLRPAPREGGLSTSSTSLFLPEYEIPGYTPSLAPVAKERLEALHKTRNEAAKRITERQLQALTLDPDVRGRRSLEKQLIIASVKRRGRMTKPEALRRSERQSLFKSRALPTSVKKLTLLMRQIAGKTVGEAMVQLRFSKKKVARDVLKGLEIAQNEAVLGRGMGLGDSEAAKRMWEAQRDGRDSGRLRDVVEGAEGKGKTASVPRTTIELRDGTKRTIRDPTEIYIDQAWVGKGHVTKSMEIRARGRVNILRHRTTCFSVLLKEEKTRMRISDEIKKKRGNRKLWVALPDRPVTAQRQYCLW